MAGTDLRRACLDSFAQLAGEDARDALVYMDAGAGEAFHFLGGLSSLLAFEPRAVCSLENASAKDADVRLFPNANGLVEKVLIITTHLLTYVHQYIHVCLRTHSAVKVFTVLTSVSEEAHAAHPDSQLGTDAFHQYKKWLMEDHQILVQKSNADCTLSGKPDPDNLEPVRVELAHEKTMDSEGRNITANVDELVKHAAEEDMQDSTLSFHVQIKHFPMSVCPLTSKVFVFPSSGIMAQAPLADINSPLGIGFPAVNRTKIEHDDDAMPIGGALLAHFLHHLGMQLSLKFDVYTLGALSHEVGKCLTELSGLVDVSVRSRKPAGLLLIDRTLDLVTPSSHSDSLLDKIFSLCHRRKDICNTNSRKTNPKTLKRHALDVRVPNAVGDSQDPWKTDFKSNTFDGMFRDQWEKGLPDLNSQHNLGVCNPSMGAISSLYEVGSTVFDSIGNNGYNDLDLLLEKRSADGLHTLETLLEKALLKESVDFSREQPVCVQRVKDLCKLLSGSLVSKVQHAELIHISKAIQMALDPVLNSKWDGFSKAEKAMFMDNGDSSQSIASQICDFVYQSIDVADSKAQPLHQLEMQKLFSMQDALTLAIVGYCLAGKNLLESSSEGPFSREEEEQLKQAVMTALLQGTEEGLGFVEGLEDSLLLYRQKKSSEDSKSLVDHETMERNDDEANVDFSDEGWEAWDDENDIDSGKDESSVGDYGQKQLQLQLRDRIDVIFGRLHRVSNARQCSCSEASEPLFDDSDRFGGPSSTRRSLIFKILMLLFAKAEIPGMEYHASLVGRILSSGFGRFGLRQVKPKFSDNKIIMVFVIGGINGVEVCEAREAQVIYRMQDDVDFMLGGTSFLTPDDMYDLLIGSSVF